MPRKIDIAVLQIEENASNIILPALVKRRERKNIVLHEIAPKPEANYIFGAAPPETIMLLSNTSIDDFQIPCVLFLVALVPTVCASVFVVDNPFSIS